MNAYLHRGTGLTVQLERDPSGMVIAFVPALPGCVSQGESVEDALTNIDDAIRGVIEVKCSNEPNEIGGLKFSTVAWDSIEIELNTNRRVA